jgi:hypothetical protein
MAMDLARRVHDTSSKLAQPNSEGSDIYLATGQDHLRAREAWHLVQPIAMGP